MDYPAPSPIVQPAFPVVLPAADEPGTLCEQMLVVLDFLSQPDTIRLDPDAWERARRRWIRHATPRRRSP